MIELRTLGTIGVRDSGDPDGARPIHIPPKRLALLAYLALSPAGTFHRRDTLVALFWPERSESTARRALTQSVYALRKSLGQGAILTRGNEEVGLDPAELWCDAVAVESALDAGDAAGATKALELYGGELLPGLHLSDCPEFESWLDERRRGLARRVGQTALELARKAAADEEHDEAARLARRALDIAPYDEAALRVLLEALVARGETARALRAYEAFSDRLAADLGTGPAAETRELIEGVRAKAEREAPKRPMETGAGVPASASAEAEDLTSSGRKSSPDAEPDAGSAAGRPAKRRRIPAAVAAAAIVALLAVGAAAALLQKPADAGSSSTPEAVLDPARIFVGRFRNATGDSTLEHLGPMMQDWLAQGLSQRGLIRIVGLSPSRRPAADGSDATGAGSDATGAGSGAAGAGSGAGAADSGGAAEEPGGATDDAGAATPRRLLGRDAVRALARQYGAGLAVWGAYYLEADSVWFLARVLDVNEGEIVASLNPVAAPATEPLSAVRLVRGRVFGFIDARLDRRLADSERWRRHPPTYRAYEQYVRGLQEYRETDWPTANEYFLRAAALDSTFLLPLLMAADLYITFPFDSVQLAKGDSLAEFLYQRRGRLAPDARYHLEALRGKIHHDSRGVYASYLKAYRLAPQRYGFKFAAIALDVGHYAEALEALRELDLTRDVVGNYRFVLSATLHGLGWHEEELEAARRARRQFPERRWLRTLEVQALGALGRMPDLRALCDSAPRPALFMMIAGKELYAHGHDDSARVFVDYVIDWFESVIPEDEAWEFAWSPFLYHIAGRPHRARELWLAIKANRPELPPEWGDGPLGVIAASLGEEREARGYSARLARARRDDGSRDPEDIFYRARIAAALGERQTATRLIQHALSEGFPHWFMRSGAYQFRSMRGYPPFEALLGPGGL